MKIKVLVVPSLAILSLVLIIGFIKPDYDTLSIQKKALEEKRTEAANVESVIQNINALSSSLDSNKETEDFVVRYFPKMLDQGRVIDAFNFLASQSGLLIVGVNVNEAVKEVDEAETQELQTPADLIPLPDGSMPVVAPSYIPPVARNYGATVTAQGSYENIKTFLEKLNRLDRIHSITLFSVGLSDKALQGVEGASTSDLIVTFQANFKYLIPQEVPSALPVPFFKESALKLDPALSAKEMIAGSVPDLNQGQTGRPNPFQ